MYESALLFNVTHYDEKNIDETFNYPSSYTYLIGSIILMGNFIE
jgi:hypothetical protein